MPGGAAAASKDVSSSGSSLRYDKATLLSLFSRTPKIPAELSKLYPVHLQKERVPIHVERQQQSHSGGNRGGRHDRSNQPQSTVSDAPHPDEAIIFSPEHLSDESHFKYAIIIITAKLLLLFMRPTMHACMNSSRIFVLTAVSCVVKV
jgi:hypothetical protein